MNTAITLPNRNAVRYATFADDEIAVTDGLNARLFMYDNCGVLIDTVRTLRAYTLFGSDPVAGGFIARNKDRGNRVFYLNCLFAEIGSAVLGDPSADGPLYDASLYDGNVYGTHENKVVMYTRSGQPIDVVVAPRSCVSTRHFVNYGPGYMLHTVRNGQNYIENSENGSTSGIAVPDGLSLKGFMVSGSNVYGAFSGDYVYTYIVPLRQNGVFPASDLSPDGILDSALANCCNL